MKEFVFLFRMDLNNEKEQPTPKQMETYMQQWMRWIDEIAGNGRLADGGNHLSRQGRLLKSSNQVIESPYISNNHSVAGYIIVRARDLDDATAMAKKCPILSGQNTSVEIRETAAP